MSKEIKEKFYIYNDNEYPVFEVTVMEYPNGEYSDVSCEFRVKEITGWEADESKKPIDEYMEDYCELTVKWDGCCHYRVGEIIDEDGSRDAYLHICGAQQWKKHVRLLHELYNRAYKYMGREPYDKAEEWNEL